MEIKLSSKEKSRKWREANPDKCKDHVIKYANTRWRYSLRSKYNISIEEYEDLLISQNNKCAICETDSSSFKKRLAVDHCHATNQVRGLLCSDCNRGIGLMKDSVDNLYRAFNYLRRYKSNE